MKFRTIASALILALVASAFIHMAQAQQAQMTIVNGASFIPAAPVAPSSFATMFGENLCGKTAAADWVAPGQLPLTLAGCSIMVNGSAAMMQYVSPTQINFIVPQNQGPGPANVVLNTGSGVLSGSMMIGAASPGVFAVNGMGMGAGAMLHGTMWTMGPFSTTTGGQRTPISIYMTGMDLSTKPIVSVGGIPVSVTFFGNAPGYPGLQQINIELPPNMAGVGRVPVTVTSNGQTSNVTFMHLLPTTGMMQGVPGWGSGMMVGENMRRNQEMSFLAYNPLNNTALVTDENDDAVRVISLDSKTTIATITLPAGSEAGAIAVNATGYLAAVVLSGKASVALIDLAQNKVVSVIGTNNYPSHVAFAGTTLLVTNGAAGSVSVIDTNARIITKTVTVGFGASGIAVAGTQAIVANMQAGSLSLINLTDYSVTGIVLPAGSRPHEIAVSAQNKVVITMPMSNSFLILDLNTKKLTPVATDVWNGMGPGAVATNGNLAFIANQMTASITVVDLNAGSVLKTFSVDPGPRSMAVGKGQLLVLAEGTGTLDLVDLSSYAITARLNAGDTQRVGTWPLPLISSFAPTTASIGTSFTLVINGSNFQAVKNIEFHLTAGVAGGGMMGGGMGMGDEDPNIKVSSIQVNSVGTQVTASVQILPSAVIGTRQIRLETDRGEVMAPMFNSFFNVTK